MSKSQLTKDKIIAVAKSSLLHDGIHCIQIRKIAKECNIAIGTFYQYFPTKDDLLLTIFRDDWKKITQQTQSLVTSSLPFKEKLRLIDQSLTDFVGAHLATFMQLSVSSGKPGCIEHHKFDAMYEAVADIIDIEKEKGTISNSIPSIQLAQFYLSCLTYRTKHQYMSFDQLFDNFKL